jgi:hypothetical protein
MTATTQRFAFTTLNRGDEFSSADYAFGRANRYQLDLLLQQVIENHTHTAARNTLRRGWSPWPLHHR